MTESFTASQGLRLSLYRWVLRLRGFRGAGRIQEMSRALLFPHLVASVANGLRIEADPWEWTQIEILTNGRIEPETMMLFEKILRSGDIYYDVGAHVGFHALVARGHVGPSGRIIAIDPQPYNCERILRNSAVSEFSNIDVVVGLAGARTGNVTLHDQGIRDKARLSVALDSMNDRPQTFRVPVVRLDDLIGEREDRNIRLLKIDVEGHEPAVIEGLGSRLENVENIVLELLPDRLDCAGTDSMLKCLVSRNFELRNVRGELWERGTALPENSLWAAREDGSPTSPAYSQPSS